MKTAQNFLISDIIAVIKCFFIEQGFSEVETPIVIKSPFPEPYIDAISVNDQYYRTSPELQMKILLAEGKKKIFEIGPCWRKGESGKLHNEKFTMLEWYETSADYNDLMDFTKEMLLYITREITGSEEVEFNGNIINFAAEWEIFSIRELFARFANINCEDALQKNKFEEILTTVIEPELSKNRPVIIKDFPAELAALAKLKDGDKSLSERWELYLGGVEIANAYTELTDMNEHYARFAKFAKQRRDAGSPEYLLDPAFVNALEKGLPDSAGCALGIDRMIMILTNADAISKYSVI